MQGHEQLEPAAVLALTGPDLLACGLSRQKLAYITDLAERFHCGSLQTKAIVGMYSRSRTPHVRMQEVHAAHALVASWLGLAAHSL